MTLRRLVPFAVAFLAVAAFAQTPAGDAAAAAKPPMAVADGRAGARIPFGPTPVLHPDLPAVQVIQYWKPLERIDVNVQAAAGAVGPNQTNLAGQTLAAPKNEPLAVLEYGPTGALDENNRKPQVYLVFSQPMVPLAKLGAPLVAQAGLSLDPPLAGVYRWISTKSVVFEPSEPMAPMTGYTCKADAGLVSIYGQALAKPVAFAFHAGSLAMTSLRSAARPDASVWELSPADYASLLVGFNLPVDAALLAPSLRARTANRTYRLSAENWDDETAGVVARPTATLKLVLADALPEDADVEILLLAGAKASRDSLATETDASLRFHTLYPFTLETAYDYVREGLYRYRPDDANAVWIDFSHPVDRADLGKYISIKLTAGQDPRLKGISRFLPAGQGAAVPIPDSALEVFGNRVRINGIEFALEATYEVRVAPGLKDIYGRTLAKGGSFSFRLGNPLSYAYFPEQGGRMLEAQFAPKVIAEVQEVAFLQQGVQAIKTVAEAIEYPQYWNLPLAKVDLSKLAPQTKHFEVLDLKPYLNKDGKGWLRIGWSAKDKSRYQTGYDPRLFLQVTDLAATVRVGYNRAVVLVSNISTGKPVAGAQVKLYAFAAERLSATTDAKGLAVFEFKPGDYKRLFFVTAPRNSYSTDGLMVRVDKDSDSIVWTPYGHDAWRYDVAAYSSPTSVEATTPHVFLFTDRRIYRPGETVAYRGIDRNLALGVYTPAAKIGFKLQLTDYYGQNEPIAENSGQTSASGGLWGNFVLPDDIEPGTYYLSYTRPGLERRVVEPVIVANFRRLQFQAAFDASALPSYADADVSASLAASYLAGGAMQGASYSGYWTKEPYYFRPAAQRWSAFRFSQGDEWGERTTLSSFDGSLDGEGRATVRQPALAEGVQGKPYLYRVRAEVVDNMTGQAVQAEKAVVVYPAAFMIGAAARVRASRDYSSYFAVGADIDVDFSLVTPAGDSAAAAFAAGKTVPVRLTTVREEWKTVQQQGADGIDTRWERTEVPVYDAALDLSAPDGVFGFRADQDGQYLVTLAARDAAGRETVCRFRLWIIGARWINWYSAYADGIELTPEKTEYKVGEIARILLKSPLPAGTYLVTTEREGILSQEVQTFNGPTQVLSVPVTEKQVPVFYVTVASYSVRSGPPVHEYGRPDLGKPSGYFGLTQVRVSTDSRRLTMTITPDKPSYLPGAPADFTVKVTRNGQPVAGAEICFMAVDRGVVDLVDYHVPDPLEFFYDPALFPLATRGGDSRSLLMDPVTYQVKDQFGGDGDAKLQDRRDFSPTAVFQPARTTSADGTARIRFSWPDNLTTYRCTAVAVTADYFGLAERDSLVCNPINVKTALPRKLRVRDTAYAGVIVTNLSAAAQDVTVKCASTILTVAGPTTRTVTVPSGATAEIAFALCAVKAGEGEISFETNSPVHAEMLTETYTVEEPVLFEATATIGSVEGKGASPFSVVEGIMLPAGVPGNQGNLEVSLGASKLPMLGGAVRYVFDYPYGCNEQKTSRVLPLVLFGEYASAFGLASRVPDPRRTVERTMAEVAASQRPDGSFGVWPWSGYASYYVTARVAHIVALMKQKNWTLPAKLDENGLFAYLKDQRQEQSPFDLSYALRVLALAGKLRLDEADAVLRSAKGFGAAEWSQLGLVYAALKNDKQADYCLQKAIGFTKQSPRSIDVDPTGLGYFNDRVSALAMLLELQLARNPSSDLALRLVNTLVAEQRAGYWQSTNTTFWVLGAFAQAVKADGKPDFKAAVDIAGAKLLEAEFRVLSGERQVWTGLFAQPPLAGLKTDTLLPFTFLKQGAGTLYYAATLTYAVPIEAAANRDEGFEVVSAITLPDGTPLADPVLRRGELYRLTARVTTTKQRTFVAVRLPVPSGADIVESFDGAGEAGRYDTWYNTRIKIFDNEAHAYVDEFYPGTSEFSILFRATAAGVYPVPPVKAECMYEPEVFGRDVSNLVLIKR
jgi:uncharacterized protein YfaS (alpha-2-macroglobulin family)